MVPTPVISAYQLQSNLGFESQTPGPQKNGKRIWKKTQENKYSCNSPMQLEYHNLKHKITKTKPRLIISPYHIFLKLASSEGYMSLNSIVI